MIWPGVVQIGCPKCQTHYALDDRLKFSLEAFDFNSHEIHSDRAHVKASANYFLNKFLYVNAGLDNFLNAYRNSYFLGVGFRFSDEDIKYYLGSVPIPR